MVGTLIVNFIHILFQVLTWAIIIRALLSWFNLPPNHVLVVVLYDVTEPILTPLRRLVPRIGMMDITPIVAIILMQMVLEPILIAVFRSAGI